MGRLGNKTVSGPGRPTYRSLIEVVEMSGMLKEFHQIHGLRVLVRSIEKTPGSILRVTDPIRRLKGIKKTNLLCLLRRRISGSIEIWREILTIYELLYPRHNTLLYCVSTSKSGRRVVIYTYEDYVVLSRDLHVTPLPSDWKSNMNKIVRWKLYWGGIQ